VLGKWGVSQSGGEKKTEKALQDPLDLVDHATEAIGRGDG
jgi:hypothetical protein